MTRLATVRSHGRGASKSLFPLAMAIFGLWVCFVWLSYYQVDLKLVVQVINKAGGLVYERSFGGRRPLLARIERMLLTSIYRGTPPSDIQ